MRSCRRAPAIGAPRIELSTGVYLNGNQIEVWGEAMYFDNGGQQAPAGMSGNLSLFQRPYPAQTTRSISTWTAMAVQTA